MKNTFGNSLTVTLFGESHGECIGAVVDGLAPGIEIDHEYIKKKLAARRPQGKISTARVEADEYSIISGTYCGYTTGTPLTLIIPNTNKRSGDYESAAFTPRPSHADYTAYCKYHGYEDRRGGGHFSGRITAALVAAGADSVALNIGGNLRTIGKKPGGANWVTGVTNPDKTSSDTVKCRIEIGSTSVVTSGDYERYFISDGQKYHHIMISMLF